MNNPIRFLIQSYKKIFVVTTYFLIRIIFVDILIVPTNSMEPSVMTGDVVLCVKNLYGFNANSAFYTCYPDAYNNIDINSIKLGDVIIYMNPNNHKLCVKRVWGLPGHTVTWNYNSFSIDCCNIFELTSSSIKTHSISLKHNIYFDLLFDYNAPLPAWVYNSNECHLHHNEIFVMGDNYWNSIDSRYYCLKLRKRYLVDKYTIVGRPVCVICTHSKLNHDSFIQILAFLPYKLMQAMYNIQWNRALKFIK